MEDSPDEVGDAIARFVQKVLAGQIGRQEAEVRKLPELMLCGLVAKVM